MNGGAIVFAASVINIFTDFLVTVLPMPLIWNLKLPTRQRIAVISIFGLGVLVNVAGSCRTVYVYKSMIASYDQTWMGWPVLISAGVEINLGLVGQFEPRVPNPRTNLIFLDLCLSTSPAPSSGVFPPSPPPVYSQLHPLVLSEEYVAEAALIDRPVQELPILHGFTQPGS